MSIIWKDAEVWTALPGLSREDQGGGRSLGSEEGGLLITLRGACHVASTAGWPCADSSGEGPMVPWLFPGDRRPGTVRGRSSELRAPGRRGDGQHWVLTSVLTARSRYCPKELEPSRFFPSIISLWRIVPLQRATRTGSWPFCLPVDERSGWAAASGAPCACWSFNLGAAETWWPVRHQRLPQCGQEADGVSGCHGPGRADSQRQGEATWRGR